METQVTEGIKVDAEPFYVPDESMPLQHRHVHAYQITLENQSDRTVQLLSRHWFIFESNGVVREVRGDGVVGLQPILAPGQRFQYSSWCPLVTDIGKMMGSFRMMDCETQAHFDIKVPAFKLIPPFKMN